MLWTNGVGRTEKLLGLKQPELKKICDEFQIPRPSSNYWIALSLEKSPQKIPLPSLGETKAIHIENYIKHKVKKKQKTSKSVYPQKTPEGKYLPRELPPKEPETVFTVPEKLVVMDPILMDTKQKLREYYYRKNNSWSKTSPYKSTPKKWLDITVSQAQEDRAIRIFTTIWRAAEAKGYHLKIDVDNNAYYTHCTSYFVVRNHKIRVQLKEIQKQARKEDGSRDPSRLIASGQLKFLCSESEKYRSYSYDRIVAQDTKYTRLEDKIEYIIEVFGKIANEWDQAELRRKQAEEQRKKEEEKARLEAEEQARIKKRQEEELNRVRELLFNAERAKIAELIRDYATKYEVAMANTMDAEQLRAKLQWIQEKAEFIDPFIERKDEWLKPDNISRLLNPEIIKIPEERSPSSGYRQENYYSYWQIRNMWWKK